jgi:hypothetical protein
MTDLYRQGPRTALLAFAAEFVPEVNIDEGFLEVSPPKGWLEIYLAPKVHEVTKRVRYWQVKRDERKQRRIEADAREAAAAAACDGASREAAGSEGASDAASSLKEELTVELRGSERTV